MNFVDQHVGARVRELRLARNMTVGAVAGALGISADEYDAREAGVERVGASELFTLAELFGVGVGAFFESMPAAARRSAE